MSSSPSYTARAVSAFMLMIGFYAIALGVAGGLLFLVWLDVTSGTTIHVRVVLGGLIGAGTILWAILPRPDRFEPPGPRLERPQQPRLFQELEGVARSTGQEMPAEVYLVADVNAWVSQRGGLLGFGGRRVMGLGLPLLQGLTRAQMLAVIVHEFGHYHGGDTRLGPVLYRTRMAIGRTIHGLGESWLQAPFRWYGTLFLRITHATSRRQEFAADALAARVAGARSMIDGLRALPGLTEAFPVYWQSEVTPALERGCRPPIAEGFGRFIAQPRVAEQVRKVQQVALGESAGDPYDTHPPLPERIAALESGAKGEPPANGAPALRLLDDIGALEERLLIHLFGAQAVQLQPLRWEEAGERIYLPMFRDQVGSQQEALAGLTVERIPELARDPSPVAERLAVEPGTEPSPEQRESYALHLLGAALALGLRARGWSLRADPGEPVCASRGDRRVEPIELIRRLREQEMSADEWRTLAVREGLQGLQLGPGG